MVLTSVGENTVMIQGMAPQSPFRPQLIPSITRGLSALEAAPALHLTRQTIHAAKCVAIHICINVYMHIVYMYVNVYIFLY